jgi:glycine/D-amino acid oxidase-like deaminating enzyme
MEVAARRAAGIPGAYLPGQKVRDQFGIARTGAILSAGSAVADPVELTAGLLRHIRQRGATLHSPVHVADVTSKKGEVCLTTREGRHIVAGHAVFCTGYELLQGVPTGGHSLTTTWAFATYPGATYPAWLDETAVWEASDPYLYLRSAPGGRLIVGGEDEPSAEEHDHPEVFAQKMQTLEAKLHALIPGLRFRVGHRWGGTFGDSASGLPRIGAVPNLPNCYYVMGFGGNGITNSVIAAQIVSSSIAGTDPDADLYR